MTDKIPSKTIPTIPVIEWEKIVKESESAHKILTSPDFEFIRNYLHKAKDSIILMFATNSIKDAVETTSEVSKDGISHSKSIKTTKEEQMNEMAGVIKFIDKLFGDLEELSKQKDEYLDLADKKQLNILVDKEDAKG